MSNRSKKGNGKWVFSLSLHRQEKKGASNTTETSALSYEHYQRQLDDLRNCQLLIDLIRDNLHASLTLACVTDAELHVGLLSLALSELSSAWILLSKTMVLVGKLERVGQ